MDTSPCVFIKSNVRIVPSRNIAKSDTVDTAFGSVTLKWTNALVAGNGVEIIRSRKLDNTSRKKKFDKSSRRPDNPRMAGIAISCDIPLS